MPVLQVKKAVAVCFLEAAKLTLEHLGAHRLELAQTQIDAPKDLTRQYADARRVRDYLQRCVSAYQEVVSLDLTDDDAALLVACCRRSVAAIEFRRTQSVLGPDEDGWLIKNRQLLSDWVVEMAKSPLIELPLRPLTAVPTEADRALSVRIDNKLYAEPTSREQPSVPQPLETPPAMDIAQVGDAGTFTSPGSQPDADAGPGVDTPGSMSPEDAPPQPESPQPVLPPLLDPDKLRDPRLRSLVKVDLGSLNRCFADRDYRLSTVLLASIMEAVTLDHVIPRRADFGLTSPPDTWKLHDVLLEAMGTSVEPKDRSLAFHLFASRNLLYPAMQMVTPVVITAVSFGGLHEFVVRALHQMGFGAPVRTLPPGFLSNEDMLS